MKNFDAQTWIGWLGATVAAAVTLTAFAYANFATKDEHRELKADIIERLQRIEMKLDRVRE